MNWVFLVLLIGVLALFSGCAQNGVNSTTASNNPQRTDSIYNPEIYSNATVQPNVTGETRKLSKCTDEEASGTEEEIDGYLEQGYCTLGTKREGMYPFPLESLRSQKDVYTKGFCCKIAAIPGRDF